MPPPPAFTCEVADGLLSWSDEGAATYYIRRVVDGDNVFVQGVSGALQVAVADDDAIYVVVHWSGGQRFSTPCGGTGVAPQPPFSCTLEGTALTWTDQGVAYEIRQLTTTGNELLADVTDALSYTVPEAGTLYVVAGEGPDGRFSTACGST